MDGHRVRGRIHMGVVALAVVLGLLAPACGGGDSGGKADKTGIDVMVSGDPAKLRTVAGQSSAERQVECGGVDALHEGGAAGSVRMDRTLPLRYSDTG